MVKVFNLWYFFFILLGAGFVVGMYFLLKNKSEKTKKIVIGSILLFNLVLHFLKLTFPPYSTDIQRGLQNIFFVNLCATSVLFFPIIFVSKSNKCKDYMFYVGVISGVLALLYPTEALNKNVATLDLWRFYICHIIIMAGPMLMVLLGLHKLDVKRIWSVPFIVMAMLLFILANHILQSELGIIPIRNDDFLNINYHNPTLFWHAKDETAVLFKWLTPDFMKVVPFGEYAGQEKYWPFFWMVPGIFFYFILIPLIMCFIFDAKGAKESFKEIFLSVKNLFKKKEKAE